MIETCSGRRGHQDPRFPAHPQALPLSLALRADSFDLVPAAKIGIQGYRSMSRLTKFKIERTSCRQKRFAPSNSPPARPPASLTSTLPPALLQLFDILSN